MLICRLPKLGVLLRRNFAPDVFLLTATGRRSAGSGLIQISTKQLQAHNSHHCSKKVKKRKAKGAYSSLWIGNPSQSYRASPATWDHTVLPATRWHVNVPHLNPSHAGRYLIYLPRRDGRLSWPWCWLYTEMVYLSADSHPSSRKNIIKAWQLNTHFIALHLPRSGFLCSLMR